MKQVTNSIPKHRARWPRQTGEPRPALVRPLALLPGEPVPQHRDDEAEHGFMLLEALGILRHSRCAHGPGHRVGPEGVGLNGPNRVFFGDSWQQAAPFAGLGERVAEEDRHAEEADWIVSRRS